jgi:chromosome partitioning protein
MSELVKEARHLNPKLKALAILNAADPQGKDNEEAAEAIKGIDGIDLLPVTIGRRKAFPNVAATGQGITEQTKDRKALQEMKSLIKTIDI